MISHCGLDLHSLMVNDDEHLFLCLLAICLSSLEKCPLRSFAHLLNQVVWFLCVLSCVSSLYILDFNSLFDISFANILFSWWLFQFVDHFLHCAKAFEFDIVLFVCSAICSAFPGGARGKELSCQCRSLKIRGFDPWIRKIPWRRVWQLTPIFLPGESHGQRSLVGCSP